MPDSDDNKAGASAEKAYAAAIETAPSPEAVTPAAKVAAEKQEVKPTPASKAKPKVSAKRKAPARRKAKAPAKTAASTRSAAPAPAKPAPAVKAPAKPAAPKPVTKSAAPKAKPAAPKTKTLLTTSKIPTIAKSKETVMKMSDKITGGMQTMMSDAQAKAKEAFEKSSAFFGDYAEFTKGNVEAMVESGKILAEGLQDMGTNLIAESRSAFESASADIKDMAAAKSPTDLIQLQSEMVRKNFDTAVAYGSKNTEAVLKLASEVMAPISSRVSLAVEKVRQTAI